MRTRAAMVLQGLVVTVLGIGLSAGLSVLLNVAMEKLDVGGWAVLVAITLGLVALGAAIRASRAAAERIQVANRGPDVEEPQPPTLDEELNQATADLNSAVGRLSALSVKAKQFEVEVQDQVKRAEAAEAMARLNEDDARRIGYLLDGQHQERLDAAIADLKKSGVRTAWITFGLGLVLGFGGNILAGLLLG